jgi:hypothetical protein
MAATLPSPSSSSYFLCNARKRGRTRRRQLPSPSSFVLFFFFRYNIAKKAATLYLRRGRQLSPPSSLCYKEMANLPFFCGFVVKKVTTAMSSPFFMVADFIFSLLLFMV